MSAVTLTLGSDGYWEARREGQTAPVGYGDDQREAYEALIRAERREATT